MNAREICKQYNVELVTPARFARVYGLELDCDGMCCDNVITVRDESNLAIIYHEIAHVLFPNVADHNVVVWLGILLYVNTKGI